MQHQKKTDFKVPAMLITFATFLLQYKDSHHKQQFRFEFMRMIEK